MLSVNDKGKRGQFYLNAILTRGTEILVKTDVPGTVYSIAQTEQAVSRARPTDQPRVKGDRFI